MFKVNLYFLRDTPTLNQKQHPVAVVVGELVLHMSTHVMLKLLSAIFYQIFIFSPNDSLSKTMKNVFYFIKKTLRSRDIQFF